MDNRNFKLLLERAGLGETEAVLAAVDAEPGLATRALGSGCSLLIQACKGNHIELARGLLDRGANVHTRWMDWDALMCASDSGYLELCTLLLDRGADPNSRDDHWTALGLATCGDHLEVCLLLIARGADLRAVMTGYRFDGRERTALKLYGESRGLSPAVLKKRRAALSAASPPNHTPAAPDGVRVLLGGARLEPLAQRRQERGQQLLDKAGRKLAPPNRGTRREA